MAHFRQLFRASYILKSSCRCTFSKPKDVAEVVGNNYNINYSVKEKLTNLGLSNSSASNIAAKPEFSCLNESRLDIPFEILGKCQFGTNSLIELIENHPLILLVDGKTLENTCINLLSMFTKKYAFEILLKCPEVLNEKWDYVCEKLKYLQEEMGVSNLDVVRHGVLKHSLDDIKIRHEFLIKTGKYKKLKPKVKPNDRHLLNPTIDEVLNTSTGYFCNKIAGVTELEFHIFQQLYYDSENNF